MPAPIFLVIGASGFTGGALLRAAAAKGPTHAFVRTLSKLSDAQVKLCKSVQQGDALRSADIERALDETGANVILLSVGDAKSIARTTLREDVGRVLVSVLNQVRFRHIRAVVIGAYGSGGTKLDYGWGIGTVSQAILKHILEDHDRQEVVLRELGERCWVIRPVWLDNREDGRAVEFQGQAPAVYLGRTALAAWTIENIMDGIAFGRPVNVVGSK